MKTHWPILAVVAVAPIWLSACVNRTPSIEEVPIKFDRSPVYAKYLREGDVLVIKPEKQRGWWLAGADVEVIDGDIYLTPINISSPGPRTLEIDLSGSEVPDTWEGRLFWVASSEHDPKKLFRRTKIYRKRIQLAQ